MGVSNMIGGFRCELSLAETNEWHKYVSDTPAYQKLVDVQHRLYINHLKVEYGDPNYAYNIIEDIEKDLNEEARLLDELFFIGEEWYFDLVSQG